MCSPFPNSHTFVSATLDEFRSIIADMDQGQQMHVVALLWPGRGDYEPEDRETPVQKADDQWAP